MIVDYQRWHKNMKKRQGKRVDVFNNLLGERRTKQNLQARKELYRLIQRDEFLDIKYRRLS